MITISDFQKVELVAGKVLQVEPHPNADKLIVLKVDVGEDEPRTLVAGLRHHYSEEELTDKTIVVVANLEPVKLRGVESHGMLLAAQDGEQVVILTLDKPVSPGARVL
jgi:methionyl-tRNA synthetase